MNDADTSLEFRAKLLDSRRCPDQSLGVVSDSAFPCSSAMRGRILTTLKDGDIDRLLPSVRRPLGCCITPSRQCGKQRSGVWVVSRRSTTGAVTVAVRTGEKTIMLSNIFHLAKYRVRTTGISQIRTMFATPTVSE
ncbi:hypothetical protein GQ600_16035 [Phytophthora cactorum]|nr:hypothetical protein GQ600_16035 [Phytophthora cactorum]